MTVESVTYVDDLAPANPAETDTGTEGAEHLRNFKTALQGTFPSLERIYHGYIDFDAADSTLPSGWTVNNDSEGKYTITHNLGVATASQFISLVTGSARRSAIVSAKGTNTFSLEIRDGADTLNGVEVWFLMALT